MSSMSRISAKNKHINKELGSQLLKGNTIRWLYRHKVPNGMTMVMLQSQKSSLCTKDIPWRLVDLTWQKGAAGAFSIPGDVILISSMFQQGFDTPHGGT